MKLIINFIFLIVLIILFILRLENNIKNNEITVDDHKIQNIKLDLIP